MNEQTLDRAAYLLFQKVKITIATVLVKSTPEHLTVEHYAAMFQKKFKKHARRVNLLLERKLFREQLLLLLPAFRVTASAADFCESMDVDVEEEATDSPQPKFYAWTNENDKLYANTIESTSRFLDAVLKAEALSSSEMISRNDVVELLRTCDQSCDPLEAAFDPENGRRFSSISSNLLKYIMKSVNVTRIAAECVSTIVDLVRRFLPTLNTEFVNRRSVMAVKYANEVLLKYTKYFPHHQLSTFVVEFVSNSTADFFALSASQSACHRWCLMYGCWRRSESACATEIHALFGVVRKFAECHSAFGQQQLEANYERIFEVLKSLLSSYAKLRWPEPGSKNRLSESSDPSGQKKAELQRSNINCWEKMVRNAILERISRKRPVIQTSWTCLKIILLMKCRLKGENWVPSSTEHMFF